jgi:RimJ/RimL family protein N-acetyltransferase
LRFFRRINIFSRKMTQDHWAHLDYRKNISLIGLVRNKGNKEIVAIGTYAAADTCLAEVAFLVREDFQGQGIAGHLLAELHKIAVANGFKSLYASVLPENKAMLRVFQKSFPVARIKNTPDEVEIVMHLDPSGQT